MSTRRSRKKARRRGAPTEVVHPNAAGIDIGAEENYVAVAEGRDPQPVRSFGCFTEDLHTLANWLEACGIDTVAMESTGVYWVPLFQVLEARGFEVFLVNARHVKNVPGRKTDVVDCQWIQQLHTAGLLSASFRPEDEICVLRSYWRHRDSLIRYAAAHVQQMQKALEQMNVQLHKVISDITGVTGMRIIRAILDGERDRLKLAQLKDHRIRSSVDRIAKALDGDYRPEHVFALRQALELHDFYYQKVAQCDQEIEQYLLHLESQMPPPERPLPPDKRSSYARRRQEPGFDMRAHLHHLAGVDFTQIEGFSTLTVQTILSEVGLRPLRFPTEKHFASWLALCPENRKTGGRIKSTRTRHVKNRAANAFRLAAQGVANSNGPLGTYYRRMRARIGPAEAITATAHKMARIFYRLWRDPDSYDPQHIEHNEQKNTQRTINYLKRKARSLGFELVPQPAPAL